MYAIIETGGKQYRVKAGDTLKIEKLPSAAGEAVLFPKVLLVGDEHTTTVGTPTVSGAVVKAELVSQGRHRKIIVQKFKPKVRYRRKHGHRQHYSEVKITAIEPGS